MFRQVELILSRDLIAFLSSAALLWMALNSIIGTAPEKLPVSLREAPQWLWTWGIQAARQFASLRHPVPDQKQP